MSLAFCTNTDRDWDNRVSGQAQVVRTDPVVAERDRERERELGCGVSRAKLEASLATMYKNWAPR